MGVEVELLGEGLVGAGSSEGATVEGDLVLQHEDDSEAAAFGWWTKDELEGDVGRDASVPDEQQEEAVGGGAGTLTG